MKGDVEVLDHLFGSMAEFAKKLEFSVNSRKVDEATRLKNSIIEIQKKISEEVR